MKANKLSKRLIAAVLSLMLVIGCFVIPTNFVGAAGETKVVFHYLRTDGNYTDWGLWAWGEGGGDTKTEDGTVTSAFTFTDIGDSENGAVATVTVDGVSKLGFIVRLGNWLEKDPDGDRFLDLSAIVSGTVDVYCKTGEADFTVDDSKAVKGLKLRSAEATSHKKINFEFTITPDDSEVITDKDFAVTSSGGQNLAISAVQMKDTTGTIELADNENLDYLKSYTVSFRDTTVKLSLPDYYSSEEFESQYTYTGNDLGATYAKEKTAFRVWAPTANNIDLNLYDNGNGGDPAQVINMTADVNGTWVASVNGDLNGKYYTYTAYFDGQINKDIVDPYAKTVGVNGQRGMIIDLDSTDPEGWSSDTRHTYENATDMSIYELHIRDFSSDPDSGITNVGKYIAFTENGTKTSGGIATGIDHLKDLGITSVHILPSYDYGSVDETKLDKAQFNWGYDPVNYNSPEGSYSTDPYHGEVRVNEYKQMVKSLHDAGIGVIMDVVYNHVYDSKSFCFEKLVPGYFFRLGQNTSGCGNDVASERAMVSKFITDSVKYWAEEYHLDGFRFDLMGILDVNTMNNVRSAVDTLDKNIFIYGEGWDMGSKPTKDGVLMANYKNSSKTPRIAYFSDTIRDAVRGNVFEDTEKGYVGGGETASKLKDGIKYTSSWAQSPVEVINYDSCHDNHTIWDRLQNTNSENTEEERILMNKMAAAITMTSQGVPFIMSGEEFLRTKVKADGSLDHNSYASPDSVNSLYYSRIGTYENVYNYYKGLLAMRKAFPQFRMAKAEDVNNNLDFTYSKKGAIGYTLKGGENDILVFFNPNPDWEVELPEGKWSVIVNGEAAGTKVLDTVENTLTVPTHTAMVLVKDYTEPVQPVDPTQPTDPSVPTDPTKPTEEPTSKPSENPTPTQTSNPSVDPTTSTVTPGQTSTVKTIQNSTVSTTAPAATTSTTSTTTATGTTTTTIDAVATGEAMTAIIFFAIAACAAFVAFAAYKKRKNV